MAAQTASNFIQEGIGDRARSADKIRFDAERLSWCRTSVGHRAPLLESARPRQRLFGLKPRATPAPPELAHARAGRKRLIPDLDLGPRCLRTGPDAKGDTSCSVSTAADRVAIGPAAPRQILLEAMSIAR